MVKFKAHKKIEEEGICITVWRQSTNFFVLGLDRNVRLLPKREEEREIYRFL
jgi:hypothetical protein